MYNLQNNKNNYNKKALTKLSGVYYRMNIRNMNPNLTEYIEKKR